MPRVSLASSHILEGLALLPPEGHYWDCRCYLGNAGSAQSQEKGWEIVQTPFFIYTVPSQPKFLPKSWKELWFPWSMKVTFAELLVH